ncbi:hypothetical protein [Cognatiyoonia koreensis]|nr:hypothetical protein [Cognatiyoonia koreensis]
MLVLHRGFDTFAMSIKATIPAELYDLLEREKAVAEEERRDVLVVYNGIQFLLRPHGGGGYCFLISEGDNGATWSFKKPNTKDPWGIRLSFGSRYLALNGLGRAKAHAEHVTKQFGIVYQKDDISFARVDYCVDIPAPNFALIPEHFVMHSHTKRRDFITAEDISVHGKSGRVTSVTVGSTTNRQVIIYDKREEITAKGKVFWWEIWSANLRKYHEICVNLPNFHTVSHQSIPKTLISSDASQSRVWRIEFRAGKKLLKDTWNIRTWKDLFARFGDLCRQSCERIRYTLPAPNDTNRARWPNHEIWDLACAEMNGDLFEMRSDVEPCRVKEVHREQHIGMIYRNIFGSTLSLAALEGKERDNLPAFFRDLGRRFDETAKDNAVRTAKQLKDAKERYVFMQKPDADDT